jgi:hypothetical protein
VLNCEEIKQLLPKFDKTIEEHDTDFLFNLDATSTQYKDFELQRVLQVKNLPRGPARLISY